MFAAQVQQQIETKEIVCRRSRRKSFFFFKVRPRRKKFSHTGEATYIFFSPSAVVVASWNRNGGERTVCYVLGLSRLPILHFLQEKSLVIADNRQLKKIAKVHWDI